MKKIRWGVLGYARIARLSGIPAIMMAPNSEFYAIASRNEEKLEQCKKEFGVVKTYTSYDELLDDPNVDCVYIPLPNSLHKDWVIKAANKGKHVLCEKPIALNAEESTEMVKTCKKNNVNLMEGFMYRFTDKSKKVKEVLDSGVIGDIKYINSTFRFFLDRENTIKMKPELGGGSIYDVGCYPLNFVGMVTDKEPISVSAEYIYQDGVDVMFTGVLKYDNGIIATINSGFNAFNRMYSEIIGTKGLIEIPDTFLDDAGFITIITNEGRKDIPVEKCERYALEVEEFADAILNNKKPKLDAEESIRNMRIMDRLLNLRKE
jgi:predicted dehydrogenase